ncbi:MAG TPA: hypothetical protein EYQ83_03470 [Acidobacteria bacterium]|nr:hypothetical protein [Acidobacteriota bacterium]
MLLKLTNTGELLLQIGGRGVSGGNTDTDNLRRPAESFVYEETNEVFVADGYGNRRVIVLDADTGAFKRMWGAFGSEPMDAAPDTPADLSATAGSEQVVLTWSANTELDLAGITRLQNLKTGALIAFSCEAGAILGEATPDHREALAAYGRDLGLAFQIADDLLDVESTEAELGKAVGKDADHGKATFIDLLGLEGARDYSRQLVDSAIGRLDSFGEGAILLKEAARFVIDRRN